MYADDTVIYYSGSEVSNIRETLQEDLNRVEQWLTDSKLILNQSKTKGLLFGTRQLLQTTSDFVLQMQGKDIERVTKFTYLGTMLDEQLHWKEHIDTTWKLISVWDFLHGYDLASLLKQRSVSTIPLSTQF